jgi:predicted Zn-dependent protease
MNSIAALKSRITTAQGYIELKMYLDANSELDELEPEHRDSSEVLALRTIIYMGLKRWELLQTVSRSLSLRAPDDPRWPTLWAYATCRADSIEAARIILVNVVERTPDVAVFHYNLACYECRLGNIEGAKNRLRKAFTIEPKYRLKAVDDEDLEAVWSSF